MIQIQHPHATLEWNPDPRGWGRIVVLKAIGDVWLNLNDPWKVDASRSTESLRAIPKPRYGFRRKGRIRAVPYRRYEYKG